MRKRGFPLHLAVAAAAVAAGVCVASPHIRETVSDVLFRSHFVARGEVAAGERFAVDFGPRFTFSLTPTEHGWCISVLERGTSNDLSRLTIPFHFTPNPRQLDGWHFRNLANTGPNDGGVGQDCRKPVLRPTTAAPSTETPSATERFPPTGAVGRFSGDAKPSL